MRSLYSAPIQNLISPILAPEGGFPSPHDPQHGREPVEYLGGPTATPPPNMKRCLEERQAECIREELIKLQTQWLEKRKQKWTKNHQPQINSADNCPTLTTR